MKYFLLIAGAGYYPRMGTNNWIDTYSSHEEALSFVKSEKESEDQMPAYEINGVSYDWYTIVDLRTWINK